MISNEQLIEKIIQTLNLATHSERKRKITLEGVTLYSSEIHLLMFIRTQQNTNLTEIAQRLRLTKGAISQTVSRLEQKGIFEKETDPYNKNEVKVLFTKQGTKVMEQVLKLRQLIENHFMQFMTSLSTEEKGVIDQFLDVIAEIFHREHWIFFESEFRY